MSELIKLAEKGSYIPSTTTDNVEVWLTSEDPHYTVNFPGLVFVKNGTPISRYYSNNVVI